MKYYEPTLSDRIHERELNNLREMTAHRELTVAAAMHYCDEHKVCPPPWLVAASAELMRNLLIREKAQKRGRAAGHIARYRQDLWDMERWDAVLAVRTVRARADVDEKIMKENPGEFEVRRKYHAKLRAWLRHGTFACAAMYLVGRNARAGVDAMKASYRRVKRTLDDPAAPSRYYLFDETFLLKLGFEGLIDRKPGTKLLPLYNLTP